MAMTSLESGLSALRHLSIRIVGGLLAPPTCSACDAPLSKQNIFCISCANTVSWITRSGGGRQDEVVAAAEYGGAVATAIRRLKYEGRFDLAPPLGDLLRMALRPLALEVDLVVPVPLHPRRLAERGFNQAALLGEAVALELAAPLEPRALVRSRFAPPQASLARRDRLFNLRGAFGVRRPEVVRGQRIALVDDVVTTGSTLSECRAALLAEGARHVTAVVVANTPAD